MTKEEAERVRLSLSDGPGGDIIATVRRCAEVLRSYGMCFAEAVATTYFSRVDSGERSVSIGRDPYAEGSYGLEQIDNAKILFRWDGDFAEAILERSSPAR